MYNYIDIIYIYMGGWVVRIYILICVHTCTEHFAETLSPSSALGRRCGLRCGDDSVFPWDGTGSAGGGGRAEPPRAGPCGLGSGLVPGRGAGAALVSAGCTDEQLLAPGSDFGRSPSTGHGGIVGTGCLCLGCVGGPFIVFFCNFFLFFSPPALSAAPIFVGARPRPY